jgi:hypothetical protein
MLLLLASLPQLGLERRFALRLLGGITRRVLSRYALRFCSGTPGFLFRWMLAKDGDGRKRR